MSKCQKNNSKKADFPDCSLGILEKPFFPLPFDQVSVLIKLPLCERCVTKKLSIIKLCKISREDAQDLAETCQVKCVNVKCEC